MSWGGGMAMEGGDLGCGSREGGRGVCGRDWSVEIGHVDG